MPIRADKFLAQDEESLSASSITSVNTNNNQTINISMPNLNDSNKFNNSSIQSVKSQSLANVKLNNRSDGGEHQITVSISFYLFLIYYCYIYFSLFKYKYL